MATTITERPYKLSFSENEIRYIFHVTDPTTPGCAVEVELYTGNLGEAPALFTTFTLYPAPDGSVYCHVKSYLKSLLKPQLPDPNMLVEPIVTQAQQFYIRYRQISTPSPDPAWQTDITNVCTVILGGVEQTKFKRNNFFVNYFVDNLPFLTWQPTSKFVFLDQVHYVTLLLTETTETINVEIKTTFTDGTVNVTSNHIDNTGSPNILFRIKAGAKELGLDTVDPTKRIYWYEIKSTGDAGVILASPFRFYIDYNHYYSWFDFTYFNSLGGLDSIRVKGETNVSVDISADDLERIIYKDDRSDYSPTSQYGQSNTVKHETYKSDVGFFNTRAQQMALTELLISKGIYQLIDGRWIRIINLKKTVDTGSSKAKKWSFQLEWKTAYDESVYTPKHINLGAGSDL